MIYFKKASQSNVMHIINHNAHSKSDTHVVIHGLTTQIKSGKIAST